jgi:hypothetical protein
VEEAVCVHAPLFNAYFESFGVQPQNIIYSDYRSSELYRAGASRGAIDLCFSAKIGISHVYNLIQEKHRDSTDWWIHPSSAAVRLQPEGLFSPAGPTEAR